MKNVRHILNEGFDRLFETKKVIKESAPNAPLTEKQKKIAIELRRTLEDCLHRKDAPTSLKDIEYALQNVIERYFPDNAWWEVADIDIFGELLSNKDNLSDLLFVPIKIAKSIKPEFLGEEKECGFEDCDDEECNESNNKELSDSERKGFISKLTAELQKEPYGYSAEEANDIAIKRADDLDPSWRVRWGNDIDKQIRQELRNSVTKKEFGEGKCNESIGDRVAEYQKWVDYDMKKYGKISGKTMGILKREGFTVVKDEYGDLEVIPEEKDHSSIKESKESDVKGWWDEVEKWNAENGNKYTIDNEDADVEDMRVAMWDMLMELKGVAPELYQKGKKIYNKYRVFTKITEGKRSNKRTFRYDVGDNKYSFYCETEDTRYGFRHLCSMFLKGQEVGDSVKKYYNRTWEMFDYQSAMLAAVENSSVSEEDKKSLKAQINEGEGLREGCKGKKCNESDESSLADELEDAFWELVSEGEKPSKKSVMERASDNNDSLDMKEARKVLNSIWSSLTDKYNDDQVEGGAETVNHTNTFEAKKCNESDDDDDISDDEYYAELEAHIKRIPSYDDEKLKAEYEEFKDSTHEDDIRVETALKDEMIKRGFLFVYEGMKVLNENAPNFAVQDGLPIYAFLNYEEEHDYMWDRAKEEYEGEVRDDGWDEFLEDFEEKYFDEYLKGYVVIDPEFDALGEDGKTLNDAIKDFNDMLKGLTNKAYDASADAWRDYENARDNEDVSDEDARKLNDKANELDDIYSYLRDLELSIQGGYHQGYQLYLDGWDDIPDDFPQEYTDAIIDAYNKVGKDCHLMKLGLAYQASNGEAGYSLIED